ncbi:MAG: radical SAM protein [archaeon]
MSTIYGPVPSWRLGRSLGVDPISRRKVCTFDCIYCQLGSTTEKTAARRVFVGTGAVGKDLQDALKKNPKFDIITFSGTGEPTLAENLGEMVDEIRKTLKGTKHEKTPVAILTNGSLLHRGDVRNDLEKMDMVVATLDAADGKTFKKVNRPAMGIEFDEVVEGIGKFRKGFQGKFCLQMMLLNENKGSAAKMAALARKIKPDMTYVNVPWKRKGIEVVSEEEITKLKKKFEGLNVRTYYEGIKPKVEVMDMAEMKKRRPVL